MPSIHLSMDFDTYCKIMEAAQAGKCKPQDVIRKIIAEYGKLKAYVEEIENNYDLIPISSSPHINTNGGGSDGR